MSKMHLIIILTVLVSVCYGVQLQTQDQRISATIHSKGEHGDRYALIQPVLLYNGSFTGQTVMIDYTKAIDPQATRVQFMIYFIVGQAGGSATIESFTKVYNTLDLHYNLVILKSLSGYTYWNQYSQSFIFPTDGTNKVTLQVEKAFSGTHHNVRLYVASYYK